VSNYYSIIKADYLQRTRSYGFLVVLAITIYAAYSFVPPPQAHYTTVNIAHYKGVYNSAWVGFISAMMTSVMLSLTGFYLVNSGIKKDLDTGVGAIIATTPITNFNYLFSKCISNFLVLLTIMGITFIMSIVMFFMRSSGYPFILSNFVFPFLLITVPAIAVVSALAILAEVFLGRFTFIQYVAYFFLWCGLSSVAQAGDGTATIIFDMFGSHSIIQSIKDQLFAQYHVHIASVGLGYIFAAPQSFKMFVWSGVNWTPFFILSRLAWIFLSAGLVYFSSPFFHRFDIKVKPGKKKPGKNPLNAINNEHTGEIRLTKLPAIIADYSIRLLVKTELLLLTRKANKWIYLTFAGLWISTIFIPLTIAHGILLPVLWFLQVGHWSDLVSKEKTNRLHYFTYASYKPIQRMLPAQMIAGILWALVLALPVIVRYLFQLNMYPVIGIICGAIFIVLLAVFLGILTGGKKLFEILFFIITYAILEKFPWLDYLHSLPVISFSAYCTVMLPLILVLLAASFIARDYETRHQ
jgi:hypothetical protein